MVQLTFACSLYSWCIVLCTKNIHKPFKLANCIDFVQFVHYLYVQKTYKGRLSQLDVQDLYGLCIICMHKKHTFQVSSRFQSKLCTSFVQFVQFLYIYRNSMYIFRTFIIKQNFDLYNLCVQNIQKLSVFIICVNILYSFFGKGMPYKAASLCYTMSCIYQ